MQCIISKYNEKPANSANEVQNKQIYCKISKCTANSVNAQQSQ